MKGSIVPRKDANGKVMRDVWRVLYDLPPGPGGKRRQKSFTVRGPRALADMRMREKLGELDRGQYVMPTKQTVEEYFREWFRLSAEPNLQATTLYDYHNKTNRYIIPSIGGTKLMELRPTAIKEMLADLKKRVGNTTRLHVFSILRKALNDAVMDGKIGANPCDKVTAPSPDDNESEALDEQGVFKFFESVEESPYRDVFVLGIYTGMRRSEALGLTWPNVFLDREQLAVRQTLHHVPKVGFVVQPAKSKRSKRPIALPVEAVDLLKKRHALHLELGLRLGKGWNKDNLVFCHVDGRPYTPSTVSDHFRELREKAGLGNVNLHGLRHSHATWLLRGGMNIRAVADRLGDDPVVALTKYAHSLPSDDKQAALMISGELKRLRGQSTAV